LLRKSRRQKTKGSRTFESRRLVQVQLEAVGKQTTQQLVCFPAARVFLAQHFDGICPCWNLQAAVEGGRIGIVLLTPTELKSIRVVLVTPRNPLNIGAAARAMSNFGFSELRVVNPYEVAFRHARSAVGASPVLASAKEFATVAEAVADCSLVIGTTAIRHRQLQQPMKTLAGAAAPIRKRLPISPVALLFGSEKWGLSNDALSHCHWVLHIPARKEHQSMNLGQAVAVCLYELVRGMPARPLAPAAKPADSATTERITQTLLASLRQSGYINPKSEPTAEEKLRRMIRRMSLEAADAEVFLGMLHKIHWKLQLEEKKKA
jgi:tRNA/rRNA methyltransferase